MVVDELEVQLDYLACENVPWEALLQLPVSRPVGRPVEKHELEIQLESHFRPLVGVFAFSAGKS